MLWSMDNIVAPCRCCRVSAEDARPLQKARQGRCMKVERATVQKYTAFLKDKHRPPSKGGNTRAWHQHALIVDGERYSFLALGAKKWVYASDTVTFDWEWDNTRQYRNIEAASVRAFDNEGKPVVRGLRGDKENRRCEVSCLAPRMA
jgi:hypothetical protein